MLRAGHHRVRGEIEIDIRGRVAKARVVRMPRFTAFAYDVGQRSEAV